MRLHAVSTEHTVDLDRIQKGGWIFDVGCRFFDLTACFSSLQCKVLAIDPSRYVADPKMQDVVFERAALVGDPTIVASQFSDSADAAHLVQGIRGPTSYVEQYNVPCYTIESFMTRNKISHFEVVKLDCEGAEFDILEHWPGPIATQISVAFHDFIHPAQCKARYPAILAHLGQWYDVIQHEPYVRHGHATPCYWDSLFTLKV